MADDVVWMPFYVGDYLADTTNLSTEQHGAYLLLLFSAWKRGGYLPDDDDQLANIVKLSRTKWKNFKSVLLSFFVLTESGWTQDRLLSEYEKTLRFLESKRENGKKGGRPRKEKSADSEKPIGLAQLKLEETQSQSHTQLQDQEQDQDTFGDGGPPPRPHQEIIDLYHRYCPALPRVKIWSPQRMKFLKARWREDAKHQSIAFWDKYFRYVAQSQFLLGSDGAWQADLEWLIRPTNFVKVIEGKYHRIAS
jgi:uncharacterized protein YdaU (DUF1376 family)